ncbi:protein NIM1-INTERACTING 1-like [Quillaja saponaria]|uniref:Protein NIM1-INTERACTING 1-like n=1 Tax=Quillaja saponaria TaxID=32244 RepID=A0AAD7QA87_QUISA|nr:protein NIM1-INTERACTING 1-like [Quillaja saponaria]
MENERDTNIYEEEDDREEEMKMEMFFSLLRNFRQVRDCDRRRKELDESEVKNDNSSHDQNKRMKKSNVEKTTTQSTWVPSFEWEDFSKEVEFKRFSSPCEIDKAKSTKDQQQEEDDGLDLKLAL